MSKNPLIPTCITAMVVAGALAGFCAYEYSTGVSADRFYSSQANTLQNAALNTITLSMRAASDASYVGQLQQVASQVDASVNTLRRGSATAGIAPIPAAGTANLDHLEVAWGKVQAAIQQISASRGNNTAFERQATEATQLAVNLQAESKDAIDRIQSSSLIDGRIKQALLKAQKSVSEGIELLAGTPTPNSDSLSLALEASKSYVATLASVGGSMPRDEALIGPLLKSYKTAQALTRSSLKAIEASSGTVDNAPYVRAIWAERENLDAAINGLQHAINTLPQSRMVTPMTLLASVGALLIVVLAGVTLILRESRSYTRKAEAMTLSVQNSQKERSQELRLLVDQMQKAGMGDLTVYFTEDKESTYEIAHALNDVFPKFREVVNNVQQTIASLSAASEETLAMAKNTERSRNEQVQAIQHIAHLVEELNNFTKGMDGVFSRTRDSSVSVGTHIATGSNAVHEVHDAVVKLAQSNLNIMHSAKAMTENIQGLENLVDVVRRAANQSATVALNAYLVADAITDDDLSKRIRISAEAMSKLSSNASVAAEQIDTNLQAINNAAKETQYVLEESQTEIKVLTGTSSNALKAMGSISEQVAQLVEGIISMAGQTKDLNERSEEVRDTMDKIHHYASDHSSASEQTATAISNLNKQAQVVGNTLSTFTV
ncbi:MULTISPECIES: methyl-accepting chemotaxis protein [Pseudomonas]|uniref:methyl-accepting chemotaxis protein n=1 Tax=Pseudomonas TaxID=286 RepID=UPI00070B727F|nr:MULTISPECIES: methyl-accepting chemotaxis protein [Pseudomonas]KQW19971.1 hypothetical protein ASC85_09030 [Pseudomonas sp. Root401]WHS57568.1 methyl-accepting chemotaxis protein [Pseudomonas brassicacearum]